MLPRGAEKVLFDAVHCSYLSRPAEPSFGRIKSAFKMNGKFAFEGLPMQHGSAPFRTGFAQG